MDIKEFKKIKTTKLNLKKKLKEKGKTFQWFWENKILKTGLVYTSFMGSLNGNGGALRSDVESIINEYVNEKF